MDSKSIPNPKDKKDNALKSVKNTKKRKVFDLSKREKDREVKDFIKNYSY